MEFIVCSYLLLTERKLLGDIQLLSYHKVTKTSTLMLPFCSDLIGFGNPSSSLECSKLFINRFHPPHSHKNSKVCDFIVL